MARRAKDVGYRRYKISKNRKVALTARQKAEEEALAAAEDQFTPKEPKDAGHLPGSPKSPPNAP